ncbi:hypothetical protein KAI65_03025 [Candidatus Parcubacteria bacterium]|nr:hypothetical protein [Candidatus Parcubacteria bacterium]
MSTATIINFFDAVISKDAFFTVFSAFTGAFIAYIFYKRGEKWKEKKEWKRTVHKEHVHLERYFNDLFIMCDKNIATYKYIVSQFKNKKTGFTVLKPFPVREDTTMRLRDLEFINTIYDLISDIKYLNYDMNAFNGLVIIINDMVKKYSEDYIIKSGALEEKQRYEKFISANVELFIKQSYVIDKMLKLLKIKTVNAMSENRFLMKISKSFFRKVLFFIGQIFNKELRREEIENEKKILEKEFEKSCEKNKKELQEAGVIW